MVRGHAKAVAQERNAKKTASQASKGSQLGAAEAALIYKCPICLQLTPNVKLLQTHYQAKHPSEQLPAEFQAELDKIIARKSASSSNDVVAPVKKKPTGDLSALLAEGLGGGKK
jgi:hypothetical protein